MSGKCSSSDKTVVEQTPMLLVLGLDQSQTMDGYPFLSDEQLRSICNALNQCNTDVCVAIGFIGNPTNEGFKRLQLVKIPVIEKTATMSVRAQQRKEAEHLSAKNLELIQQFIRDVQLVRPLTTKTCLNKFCADAAKLLSEPQFNEYTKMIMLYSDGLEDCSGKNKTEPLKISFLSEVSVYVVGWKNKQTIEHTGIYKEFADLHGFVQFINSLTK